MIEKILLKNLGTFASGVFVGTAGAKVLTSKDAKKVYTNIVAAGLRAKDEVVTTTKKVQEGVEDIFAEAKEMNRVRKETEEKEKAQSNTDTEKKEFHILDEEIENKVLDEETENNVSNEETEHNKKVSEK